MIGTPYMVQSHALVMFGLLHWCAGEHPILTHAAVNYLLLASYGITCIHHCSHSSFGYALGGNKFISQ